jgi:hypothetical protein
MRNLFHCTLRRDKRYRIVTLLLALSVTLTVVPRALAHTRVEIGPYAVVVGWLEEPAIVGERNAFTIEVSEDDAPVEGLAATLNVEVVYAGRTFRTDLNTTPTPGHYTAEIFPTIRGQYSVRLFGMINDLAVDEVIEPEEVFPAARIQFPEAQPDSFALQAEVVDLEAELQTARTLVFVSLGVGLLGVALAVYSLLRRR